MQAATLESFSKLLLSIYRSAQELPVHEFQDAILELIKTLLPFDSSMWGTATMQDAGIDIHSIHLHRFVPGMLEAYQLVKHQDTAAVKAVGAPRVTLGFDAQVEFNGPDQDGIRRFADAFGHRHFFITSDFHPVTRFGQWVTLFRSDPGRPCTEDERLMLENLAPHLMQALAINRLVHLDRLTGDITRESWSVAIADTRGVLYHADPRFRALVESEWPPEAGDRLNAGLLAQLNGAHDQVAGRGAVVRRTLERGLLFMKARERAPVDTLSTREFMVATLLATGLTQKEVAARLGRSPETIRSQVRTVFDKLRINSATMLAPLLALRE